MSRITSTQYRQAQEIGNQRIIEHGDDRAYQARMRQLRQENSRRTAAAALATRAR